MRDGESRGKRRAVATGPRTDDGKQTSSRNSTTHGCRSEKHVVLPGESADEYRALQDKWLVEYPPTGELDRSLIERLAQREWHLRRCERILDETQENIMLRSMDPFAWTDEDHKVLQLMQRYHTKAERSFRAAWQDLENLRRNRIAEVRTLEGAKRAAFHNVVDGISTKQPAAKEPEVEATEEPVEEQDTETPGLAGGRNDAAQDGRGAKWPVRRPPGRLLT